MTTTDIKKRWYIWIFSAVMLAAILYLFFRPIKLADIIMPSEDVSIERIILTEVVYQENPKILSLEDSKTCGNFLACFKESSAQRRFFHSSAIVQDHGVLYLLSIYYSNGEIISCDIFDGKLYCGMFSYTIPSNTENSLMKCITSAIGDNG